MRPLRRARRGGWGHNLAASTHATRSRPGHRFMALRRSQCSLLKRTDRFGADSAVGTLAGALVVCAAVVGVVACRLGQTYCVPGRLQHNRRVVVLPFTLRQCHVIGRSSLRPTPDTRRHLAISADTANLRGALQAYIRRLWRACARHQRAGGLGVQYRRSVGHVQGDDKKLKLDVQLVDTATRTNVLVRQFGSVSAATRRFPRRGPPRHRANAFLRDRSSGGAAAVRQGQRGTHARRASCAGLSGHGPRRD